MLVEDCLALILAGGKGTRLAELTQNIAKPAVPFAGKYRIIDFTLSNCHHSGIHTVGILTQYKPFELSHHIGEGGDWDLHGLSGGVFHLPPYTGKDGGQWYRGTADAVYQNLNFIHKYAPTNVLVLSGDHIYQMDYRKMLNQHVKTHADVTIAVLKVPIDEAHRFGIMNTDNKGRIYEFEEKPDHPKNNLASMGIYIFKRDILENYLVLDQKNPHSSKDFGKDIIPRMVADGKRLFAYVFDGYWRDVGTVHSYYEAHMDLIKGEAPIDFKNGHWPLLSKSKVYPPQYISEKARVVNSIISEGSVIAGDVTGSVLSPNVTVHEQAIINNSIILKNVTIGKQARINRAIIYENVTIKPHTVIGAHHKHKVFLIPEDVNAENSAQVEEVLS